MEPAARPSSQLGSHASCHKNVWSYNFIFGIDIPLVSQFNYPQPCSPRRAPRKARAALRKENVGGEAAQRGLRRLHRPRLRACSPDLRCLFGELRLRQGGRIALQSSHLHLQRAEMHTSTRNRNMAERRVLMIENALFKHTRSKIKIYRCSYVNMEFS